METEKEDFFNKLSFFFKKIWSYQKKAVILQSLLKKAAVH